MFRPLVAVFLFSCFCAAQTQTSPCPLTAIKITPHVYRRAASTQINRMTFDLTLKNVSTREIAVGQFEIQRIGSGMLDPWDDVPVNLNPGESKHLTYSNMLDLPVQIKKMAVVLWTVRYADGGIDQLSCLVGSAELPEPSEEASAQIDNFCSGPNTLCVSAEDSDRDFAVSKGEYLINASRDYMHRNGHYYQSKIEGRAVIISITPQATAEMYTVELEGKLIHRPITCTSNLTWDRSLPEWKPGEIVFVQGENVGRDQPASKRDYEQCRITNLSRRRNPINADWDIKKCSGLALNADKYGIKLTQEELATVKYCRASAVN